MGIEIVCECARQANRPKDATAHDLVIILGAFEVDESVQAILNAEPRALREYLQGGLLRDGNGNALMGVGARALHEVVRIISNAQPLPRRVLVLANSMTLALLALHVIKISAPGYDHPISEGQRFKLPVFES